MNGGVKIESTGEVFRFGVFEVDMSARELRRDGQALKLRAQSFHVLVMLLGQAGETLSREAIRAEVWGTDTFVDFERGINSCIREIRAALGDQAGHPVYIETLPRVGYRFIAPVQSPPVDPPEARRHVRRRWGPWFAVPAVAVLVALGMLVSRDRQPGFADRDQRVMLAVLPFENLSGDPAEDYFSEGLTEEMVTQLGRIHPRALGVVSRISAGAYRHRGNPIETIGHELGVAYVLVGSVRRARQRVRITAKLIQVSDQRQIWAQTYERELRDILEVQRSAAMAVGQALHRTLRPAPGGAVRKVDPEAYVLLQKARFFWNKRDSRSLETSIRYFEQAIARQPDYALAYAGLADAYIVLGARTAVPPAEVAAKARAAARKALAIDPTAAEARTALAMVTGVYDWNWTQAEAEFRRAIDTNPSYPTARHWYAHLLRALNRTEEARAEIRIAAELAPLSLIIANNVALGLLHDGAHEAAAERFRAIVEMEPDFASAHRGLGRVHLARGRIEKATAAFERATRLSHQAPRHLSWLGYAHALAGRGQEALAVLARLEALEVPAHFDAAAVAFGLGRDARAFRNLTRAVQARDPALRDLLVDERFNRARRQTGFRDVARRVGLPKP